MLYFFIYYYYNYIFLMKLIAGSPFNDAKLNAEQKKLNENMD